jgi:hypothetical protein
LGVPPPKVEFTELIPNSDKVYFVVSAPSADEAADQGLGRADRRFYGPAARDWAPYRPVTDEYIDENA